MDELKQMPTAEAVAPSEGGGASYEPTESVATVLVYEGTSDKSDSMITKLENLQLNEGLIVFGKFGVVPLNFSLAGSLDLGGTSAKLVFDSSATGVVESADGVASLVSTLEGLALCEGLTVDGASSFGKFCAVPVNFSLAGPLDIGSTSAKLVFDSSAIGDVEYADGVAADTMGEVTEVLEAHAVDTLGDVGSTIDADPSNTISHS